ncbi:odorant receptor 67c-like [Aphidius gifuensis]|uniref:odorant receptor 67c-like n=1 Tax=Aphidius gifuensis TaxID=684658 RepID=UPI001CDCC3FF|nr:odorant receptor 67c-like [Aphidius gifuensis]
MWHPKTTQDAIISMTITVYTITAQSIGLIVMLIDIYYIFGDIRAIAFNIPVTVSIIQELFKMITFTINRGEVQSLNKYTEETFWKSKYDESEILILKKCNKVCIVSCEYDGGNLSLPFNVYFEASKYTPIFEICYFIQAASTIGVSVCSTAFCTYLFTINVYAAGLFQILQRKLIQTCQKYSYKKTNDGLTSSERTKLSYERLKKCIQHHQVMIKYMDTIEYLYSPINFIFAIGAVGTICLNGFQVVMGGENSFHRNALSIEFFIGSIVLLYMACYSCQKIFVESLAVGDNLYNANFYDLSNEEEGKYFRQALIFVIMRSQKPCVLTMWGFSVMSIEIFTKVLTKSMSFFTIFRQMLDESQEIS